MHPNYRLVQSYPKKGKLIAFYSLNINISQKNYTTTEEELLSIVAYLKESNNILLGHQIIVYTAHKNQTYKDYKKNIYKYINSIQNA